MAGSGGTATAVVAARLHVGEPPGVTVPRRRATDRPPGVAPVVADAGAVRRCGGLAVVMGALAVAFLASVRGGAHPHVHLSVFVLGLLIASAVWVPAVCVVHVRAAARGDERDRLVARLTAVSDVERRRIAAEVHDGVLQDLVALRLQTAVLAATSGDPCVGPALGEVGDRLQGVTAGLRSLLQTMYPVDVPPGGWQDGIADLCDALARAGVRVLLDVGAPRPSPVHELVALRVTREALRNVAAHAGARHVWVTAHAAAGRVVVTVDDDGCGFDDEELAGRERLGHYGLRLLRDLACEAGAALTITSRAGRGTTVRLELEEGAACAY